MVVMKAERSTVVAALCDTFATFGMPKRILCDNGPPWGNTQPGFRWTELTVWLLDLGVSVSHSRPMHPQTLGKDERFHRTMDLEVIKTRSAWDSHQQVQEAFDRWRGVYNHQRPHEPRTVGHRNPVEIVERDLRLVERAFEDRHHLQHVLARGDLGHDAPIAGVHGDLR